MMRALTTVLVVLLFPFVPGAAAQSGSRTFIGDAATITIRAAALAQVIDKVAGYPVNVPGTKIVWIADPHAMVIESDSSLDSLAGRKNRILVLIGGRRSLVVPRTPVMASPVTIVGTARTLLGVQVAHDVPWPRSLTANLIDRLEIRAAVVATSVQTPDGVELTSADTTIESQ